MELPMSPTYKSLLILLISGILFTILLVGGQSASLTSAESDVGAAELATQQLSLELGSNLSTLSEGLISLSNNAFWQESSVVEWPQRLSSQQDIYKAAGLNILGMHAKANDVLYMEKINRPGQLFGLKQPLERLYKNKRVTRIIQTYKEQPAVILMVPVKTVENEVIGSLIGVKFLNTSMLKNFHYISKAPAALLRNNQPFDLSVDTSPNFDNFELVPLIWPKEIQSSVWQIALMVKKDNLLAGYLLQLILGLIITLVTIFLVWQQLRIIQNTLKRLNTTLNLDLPITEQIKALSELQNTQSDAALVECSQAIRGRLQQLTQQKKALSIEVRKLQESQQEILSASKEIKAERDSAVAAPRLKSEFLSRMGDEITTPMKSVVSMLKLLSEYPFEAEPKQLLNIAKRSTRTLVDNLNNILDFSKLDAKMLKLKPREFNVRELVDDLSSELAHFANEKDLSLQASSDAEVPAMVKADVFRVKQILRNLLGNAIRFTKSGEVSLYTDVSAKNGHKLLRFTIADTGIGLSPEAQKEIFDSLQQTTKLSNASFAGRLRLIVSKHLAEQMGGEIGVISEIGQGSQFWFTVAYTDPD